MGSIVSSDQTAERLLNSLNIANCHPAVNWFLTYPNEPGSTYPRSFHRVVMWRAEPDGKVIGLISERRGPSALNSTPRLTAPEGNRAAQYVHWDDLSDAEKKQATEMAFASNY